MIKKYIILGIRIVCLFLFVLFVIPVSLFILSLQIEGPLQVKLDHPLATENRDFYPRF